MLGGISVKNSLEWFQNKVMPYILKMSENHFLVAVRNGIAVTMPLTIIGSAFLIIANLPFAGWTEFLGDFGTKLGVPVTFTFGILGLVGAAGIAYYLALHYKIDPVSTIVLTIIAFLMLQADPEWGINLKTLDASGLFTGIIVSIFTAMLLHFFVKKNWIIKLPDGVPPAVAKSFASLVPGAVLIGICWIIRVVLNFDVNQFIQMVFSPLAVGLNSLPGMLLYTFCILLLWCAGIHGSNVMGSIGDPIFLALFAANVQAFEQGQTLPNIFPGGFYITFLCLGGTGSTLGLVINMLMSKSRTYKSLGKMSLPSAIFCINEPVIFGFPIVMNPIMMVPFILTPLVLCVGTYLLSVTDIIGRIAFNPPWTTPPVIAAYLATGGNIPAAIWSVISIFISIGIYYPFFKMCEKEELKKELAVEKEENLIVNKGVQNIG